MRILVPVNAAVNVMQAHHRRAFISNVGAQACYLDDQPQVSKGRGYRLLPNQRIIWEADTPCYVISDPLGTTSIDISMSSTIRNG